MNERLAVAGGGGGGSSNYSANGGNGGYPVADGGYAGFGPGSVPSGGTGSSGGTVLTPFGCTAAGAPDSHLHNHPHNLRIRPPSSLRCSLHCSLVRSPQVNRPDSPLCNLLSNQAQLLQVSRAFRQQVPQAHNHLSILPRCLLLNHLCNHQASQQRIPLINRASSPARNPLVNPLSSQICIQLHSLACTQPTSQPTQQPTIQPTIQPVDHPTYQPTSTPTVQPSCQPSARPTVQPVSIPSAQPSSAPSTQPTGSPSVCPSLQPSMQPSRQPSTQPYAHPTAQPSLQPSKQPTAQPSIQPLSWPTGVPTLSPTINNGEWSIVIQNTTDLHTVVRVDNNTWVCSTERYTCTALQGAVAVTLQSLKVSVKYTFVTGPVSSVITAIDVDGVMIINKNTATVTSSLSKCTYAAVQTTDLICKTTTFSNANFVDATYNIAAGRILYIGTVGANVVATVIDPNLGTTRGFYYTTDKVNSIYLQHATSLSDYFSSFIAGTCVDRANSAKHNIIAGRVRFENGAMGAMIIKPQSGYFRNKVDLVTSLLGYSVGPDLLIAGGIELNTEVGMNGYFLRVNSIFSTFSYARRLRHRVENRRLSTLISRYESVVRGMVMDGRYFYMIVDNIAISAIGNSTGLSVLEVDPISGNIVQQVSISAANSSILCTDITTTTVGFILTCTLFEYTLLDTPSSQLLLSVEKKLTFSKLPPGFTRSEESIFDTESIALVAIDAQMSTVSATIPSTSYQHTISATSTQTQAPTRQPTVSVTKHPTENPTLPPSSFPTQYRSSDPSGQPNSSPTAQPSVSPQPTSQPSTASPTITHKPTRAPSGQPTVSPMLQPTALPSVSPTIQGTVQPTIQPSGRPMIMLTVDPSIRPSTTPPLLPTRQPTTIPATDPTNVPSLLQSPFATVAPILSNTSDAGVDSNNDNNNVPNYLIGVTIVGAVVALVGVCCCYHRYKAKQKDLILTQVVPSTMAMVSDAPAINTEATCLKLSAANSIRSSSFTVSSLHSSECSSDHEFSQSLDGDSVMFEDYYRSDSSQFDDEGDVYCDEDEMNSTGSCEESSQFSESEEGEESVHSDYYSE